VDLLGLSRGRTLAAAGALLAALFVAGRYLVPLGAPSVPHAVAPPPAPAAPVGEVVVHVVGAVRRPGLYHLRLGARIADAVRRAGGTTRRADTQLVNLAAPLADGQQVVVPRRQVPGTAPAAGPGGQEAVGPVHLSTATLEELDSLPGVGPVTAQKIVDYREKHGAFTSVEELDAIPGIGPARIEQLRDAVAP
jgi:competence protein ComEA